MHTYKGEIKNNVRELFWKHAVESLTENREVSELINPQYVSKLWRYCQDSLSEVPLPLDDKVFEDWLSFSKDTYGIKCPENLRVVFLCGEEPENDVSVLLSLGVRIENIYAIESDSRVFATAVESLEGSFPTLKIFRGSVENFLKEYPLKFDIIYLDYTASLFNKGLCNSLTKIMVSDSLEDLSILCVNSTYPDDDDAEAHKLVSNYLYYQEYVEYSALNGGTNDGRFEWDCVSNYDEEVFRSKINEHFKEAYSAYQTSYIANNLCLIKPFYHVLNSQLLKNRLFGPDEKLRPFIDEFKFSDTVIENAYQYSLLHPYSAETGTIREVKQPSCSYTIRDITTLMYVFLDSKYDDYQDILSEALSKEADRLDHHFVGYFPRFLYNVFCDVPMIHLFLELAIYQMGHPYHMNLNNHKRFSYTDKTRSMCMDVFTLDKCRSLYEWLPTIEQYANVLMVSEQQMIARICIDAINKQTMRYIPRQFYGGALIGANEEEWTDYAVVPERESINNDVVRQEEDGASELYETQ